MSRRRCDPEGLNPADMKVNLGNDFLRKGVCRVGLKQTPANVFLKRTHFTRKFRLQGNTVPGRPGYTCDDSALESP
jgi:hypothetical protein